MDTSALFVATPKIMEMVQQFHRETDIVQSNGRLKLCPQIQEMLSADLKHYDVESLKNTFLGEFERVQMLFEDLVRDYFHLELAIFNLRSEESKKGNMIYFLELYLKNDDLITINASKLGAKVGNGFLKLLQEKPSLIWITDSRSPFYLNETTEMLEDIEAVSNLRANLRRNPALLSEVTEVLAHHIVGVRH